MFIVLRGTTFLCTLTFRFVFYHNINVNFFFRARAEKGIARHKRDLFETRIVRAKSWDLEIFDWFVLSMHMQVFLDCLFAHPVSAPIGGWKKGEFRDWTNSLVNGT